MTSIVITSGGGGSKRGSPDAEFTAPDGVYPVILVSISDPITKIPTGGFNAGKEWTFQEWTVAIDMPGDEYDGQTLKAVATLPRKDATGRLQVNEKSNYYGFMTAFFGKSADSGTAIDDIETYLIGRSAMAKIVTDDNDYPKVDALFPAPAKPRAATPAATPKVETRQPVAAGVGDDGLPF